MIIVTLHFASVNNINQDTNTEQTMIGLYQDFLYTCISTCYKLLGQLKYIGYEYHYDNYITIQELAGGSEEAPVSPDEQSTPEQCISKLTALIRFVHQKIPPYLSQIIFSNIFCSFLSPLTFLLHLASPHFNIFISDSFLETHMYMYMYM